jgi:hypothetical protein
MRVRHAEFQPWLLGWCRWEVVFESAADNGITVRLYLAQGSWRWRGRRAHYREDVYEVNGVGEINCDDQWVANELLAKTARGESIPAASGW